VKAGEASRSTSAAAQGWAGRGSRPAGEQRQKTLKCTSGTYTERAWQRKGAATAASATSGHWSTSSVVRRTPTDVRRARFGMSDLKAERVVRREATAQRLATASCTALAAGKNGAPAASGRTARQRRCRNHRHRSVLDGSADLRRRNVVAIRPTFEFTRWRKRAKPAVAIRVQRRVRHARALEPLPFDVTGFGIGVSKAC
jgi:hypothetical protein